MGSKELIKIKFFSQIIFCVYNTQERGRKNVKYIQRKEDFSTFIPSKPALKVLHIGLPVVLMELVALLISFLRDCADNPTYALHRYPILFEHLMMSLTLIIIGAFLFDILSKRK